MQAFHSFRSGRQAIEQFGFDHLLCGFVGLCVDDPVQDAIIFTKSRDRLLRATWARDSWPLCSARATPGASHHDGAHAHGRTDDRASGLHAHCGG